MYTLNQLTIIGFTGSDAEAHYTPNGTLVTTLSIATKESWKDATGPGKAVPTGIESSRLENSQNMLEHWRKAPT